MRRFVSMAAAAMAAVVLAATLPGCGRERAAEPAVKSPRPEVHALFDNVVEQAGIDFRYPEPTSPLSILDTTGFGVGLIDFDADGLPDLVLLGKGAIRLYRNIGGLKFADVTASSGLTQEGYWFGVAVGDYDNDGRDDLYVCGYNCSALYHNEGAGRFKRVENSGLDVRPPNADGIPEWRTVPVFVDLDGDGRLDLVVGRYVQFGPKLPQLCGDPANIEKYSCPPDIYKPEPTSMFRNLGGGRFEDISSRAGMAASSGRTLGIAVADYNGDGRMDVAVANDEMPGDLFLNRGGTKFENRGRASGTAFNMLGKVHGGMGIDWGDYDGDGKPDLFVATYQNEAKNLYHNLGSGIFMDGSLDAGLSEKMDQWVSFGVKFLDFDRDGHEDLIITNGHVISNTARIHPGTSERQPIQLFRNLGRTYEDVTSQMGDTARRPIVGRGLAVGDLDNDGKLDVVVIDRAGRPVLLRNGVENQNHWLSIKLTGTKSNRDGIGARVTVKTAEGMQYRTCTNGGSYASANDLRVYFGLGGAAAADVEIAWPSGARQKLTGVAADARYEVTEGESGVKPLAAAK